MRSVEELRRMFRDCEGRSDDEILQAYHAMYYSQTPYESFLRQHKAVMEARKGKGGGSGGRGEGKSRGPDRVRREADRAGCGLYEKTGNYYPYLRDENGKLVLNDKDEPMLDFNAGPISAERLAEIELKANGEGLARRPQVRGRQPRPYKGINEMVDDMLGREQRSYEGINEIVDDMLPKAPTGINDAPEMEYFDRRNAPPDGTEFLEPGNDALAPEMEYFDRRNAPEMERLRGVMLPPYMSGGAGETEPQASVSGWRWNKGVAGARMAPAEITFAWEEPEYERVNAWRWNR